MSVEDKIPDIVELRNRGHNYDQIATLLNISILDIPRIAYRINKCLEIYEARSKGFKTARGISEHLGTRVHNIYRYARMANVSLERTDSRGRKLTRK